VGKGSLCLFEFITAYLPGVTVKKGDFVKDGSQFSKDIKGVPVEYKSILSLAIFFLT
jgi:hypothetical protein